MRQPTLVVPSLIVFSGQFMQSVQPANRIHEGMYMLGVIWVLVSRTFFRGHAD